MLISHKQLLWQGLTLAAIAIAAAPVRAGEADQPGTTAANAPVELDSATRNAPPDRDEARTVRRGTAAQRSNDSKGSPAAYISRGGASAIDAPGAWWPLAAVLAVMACCLLAVRRWLMPTRPAAAGSAIRVLSRQYLSNKQSLCLARVGRRIVLLGITPERISILSEVTDADEVSELLHVTERGRAGSFSSVFDRFIERDAAAEPTDALERGRPGESARPSPRHLADTRQRVEELIDRVRGLSSNVRVAAEPPRSVRST
jgi:flagellar biogenesis protein FliO